MSMANPGINSRNYKKKKKKREREREISSSVTNDLLNIRSKENMYCI